MNEDEPHDLMHGAAEALHGAADAAQEAAHEAVVVVRRSWRKIALVVAIITVMVFGGLLAAMRYGVLLPQARLLIQAATNGLKVGRFGRLHIEGLEGDIWTDLRIGRLTLSDETGVWLEADQVRLKWRYIELLRRNFQAEDVTVGDLKLIRRPSLSPAGGQDTGLPLSFHIDHGHGRLELMPGFSDRHGVYDLDFNLHVRRKGGSRGRVRAASVLRPGDHLNLDYDVRANRPLLIVADAVEAKGGALAGAVGLPSDQPFALRIKANGRLAAGQFTAVALSGEARPLDAAGAWTPTTGQASGRVALTASRLTAGYAARFGPEVRFEIAGRKAGPDLFALQAKLASENLNVTASGLGDLGKRTVGPQGVQIAAATAALSRISGGPTMGPARLAGVLSQTGASWRFAGQGSVERASLGAYQLARVSGPVVVTYGKGDLGLNLQLAGAGGRGAGFVGAAFGATPRAAFEGAKLADGRLELKKLEIAGAGLKLSASGGRGLLGGLSFKGQARLANLAAARPGASGSASATWSASQRRAGQPWALSLDAHGDRLTTGWPELDRLLGPKPVLTAKAEVQGRRVAVQSAALDGAALDARTAGVLAPDGTMALKVDWSANGPFRAGPVEIAGKARGSGALTGTPGAPKVDLIAHLDAIAIPRLPLKDAQVTLTFQRRPDGAAGIVSATAGSGYGPARGRAAFRFPQGGVDLTDVSVDAGGVAASGALSLRRGAPSAADLDLTVVRGAFLDAGKIAGHVKLVDAAGGRASLNLTAENARWAGSPLVLKTARLTADGSMSRLPYTLAADGTSPQGGWSASGRGVLSEAKPGWAATFDGSGQLGGRNLRTVQTASFRFGGPERSATLRLAASDGGRIDLDGRMTDQGTDVRAQVAGLGLAMLDEDFAGKVDATLNLQGRGPRLDGALEARLENARGRGAPAASGVDGTVRGRLSGGTLTLVADATNAQGLQASGEVALPAVATAAPFRIAIAEQQPMHGRFSAVGEVRPLWDLLIGGDRSLSGRVRTQGALSGTLAAPRASGDITVENGRFDDGETGLSLRQVSLRAGFAESAVNVTQASGVDGHGGSVTGAGVITLQREGLSSFKLNLNRFRLIDNERATASASGQATIARAADGRIKISGDLVVDQATVAAKLPTPSGVVRMDVIEKNRPDDLPPLVRTTGPTGGDRWALDVGLRSPGRVLLKGRGLNVELALNAHVGGTVAHPQLSGTATVVRGDYDFAGKRFEFDPSSTVYLASDPDDIRLELLASRDDPTLTANVRIRGTAARPEISLTSTPSLPSDEILAQVLFGQSASQLSGAQAAELASAVSSMAGGGGLDVIGNLRAFAGLDRLALGTATGGGVSIAGGKYLTNNVYLEIAGGGREGPSAEVEWRVKRKLSIVSKVGAQGEESLAIRWRTDY